ncbi:ATP-dependent helicase HrpB [Puteibacter caeruleilacunae]|nr:ATP-dependent helicase HrpB [Puteibacter caeruleilacunae]
MKFTYSNINLPVAESIPAITKKLSKENTLILSAPPGAGKSTLVPPALLEEPWLNGKKIIMLEPRRLAARSIAARIAELLHEQVGETVGYRIRFEQRIGPNTRLEVVTEGILTRMLQSDNALEDVGLVIFDEFHERSIFADVALALCRESQQILRPDLRILIMSATLDMPKLSELLNAKIVESKGRMFPVKVIYTDQRDEMMLPELTARTVLRAAEEQQGDILVFLPGVGEIRRCESILRKELSHITIHPLYGMLPPGKQYAAITPDKNGKRKIVLATSIAETSLTIEGISTVVDCGYSRTSKFDSRSGLSKLQTIDISQDSAEQRTGRAGRLGPGVCYRMWNKATHQYLKEHRTPEILEADLASLMLDMAQWGVKDITQLTWLTPPPKHAVFQAKSTLHHLQALENDTITPHGKEIHNLPCHPRIAHMLIMAKHSDMLPLATDIAAILEERDPLTRDAGIDINLRIEALRRHRSGTSTLRSMNKIDKAAASYRNLFKIKADNSAVNPYETGLLLVHAYPERIAHAKPGNNAPFQMANGAIVKAGKDDDLAYEPWLAIAHVNAQADMGRIFLASPLNPQDLQPLVKSIETITWDTRKGGIVAVSELRIGNIILQSKPLQHPDPEDIMEALNKAIEKEGQLLLNFNDEFTQLQNRIISLSQWDTTSEWPDVSTSFLLKTNADWLTPYLNNIKKTADLKQLNLKDIVLHALPWELQEKLDTLAPERIKVPSGSRIKLNYQADGSSPILAVRIQEVFSMTTTPQICNNQVSVLMHLLSPASRPIQITSDLRNFWANTYFEVRKELRIKYAKHYWPEDPLKAEALRGVKRKKPSA